MYVRSVSIQCFRGIQGPFTIDFPEAPPPPGSLTPPLLILGSNGSGKSSICEAIEFGVRGSVSRRYIGGEKDRRELANLVTNRAPAVTVELSNGEVLARGKGAKNRQPHDAFSIAPLIIRRKSVETFWGAPEKYRLEVFWDYFKPNVAGWRTPSEQQILDSYCEYVKFGKRDLQDLRNLARRKLQLKAVREPRTVKTLESLRTDLFQRAASVRMSQKERFELEDIWRDFEYSFLRIIEGRSLAKQIEEKPEIDYEKLRSVIEPAGNGIASQFREIANIPWIEKVELEIVGKSGLRAMLELSNGTKVSPDGVLSEAYLDLLALLILVKVHTASANLGQAKVVILDDVFQSVDAPLRQGAMHAIVRDLPDWQLIITMHDRLWSEILVKSLSAELGVKPHLLELRREPGAVTPHAKTLNPGMLSDLQFVKEHHGSPVLMVATAGRVLEAILEHLSMIFRCRVSRAVDDKYTIGDLLVPVVDVLRANSDERVRDAAGRLSDLQQRRNLFGAHYHPEADSISPEEAQQVAEAVEVIAASMYCATCGRIMKKGGLEVKGDSRSGLWSFECLKPAHNARSR
ncbi:AAA family ATPase [Brachybacterium phenoliresistens]|uniref:AAA family ATPase n=1 Tax=Brachybacterium phenoliresistens TaxID=396014 RepID=UPI0009FFD1ED|nr:AAA family ATPase [Brachybacterium phenoliresistens]